MGAPNPWFKGSPPLSSSEILKQGEHPLDLIREFILNWPGEETVKLDDLTRHNRLVQIIAGYPEIDVGRYPLDWPLSNKAAKALRLTLYLDSIHSPDSENSTSLRSVLLNKSYNMRGLEGAAFRKAHRRLITILLLGLRVSEGINCLDSLTSSEHKFLVSLHSNNQNRVSNYWPLREMKGVLSNSIEHLTEWNNENYLPTLPAENHFPKQWCKGWKNNEDIEYSNHVGKVVTVKMRSIQKWISNWSDCGKDKLSKIESIMVRGSSAILESTMSMFRSSIIERYGVESIIVDGGGRIQFLGDNESEDWLRKSFTQLFQIRNRVFNFEIQSVAKILSGKDGKLEQSDFDLIYGIEAEMSKEKRDEMIERWIEKHLPKLAIDVRDGWEETEEVKSEFIDIKNEGCIFCEKSKAKDSNLEGSWEKLFSSREEDICSFHRLLYKIGRGQSMVNSTVKEHGNPLKFEDDTQRRVIAITRLDLNSLGVLFTSKFEEGFENSNDTRRRRSIRFNSQWWAIVKRVLDRDDLNHDRIAPWVAAGDDLILAEYMPNGTSEETRFADVLSEFSLELQNLSEAEYGEFDITFGAGVSIRNPKQTISKLMDSGYNLEDKAKNLWKEKMDEDAPRMLVKANGEKAEYRSVELSDLVNPIWLGKSIVLFGREVNCE